MYQRPINWLKLLEEFITIPLPKFNESTYLLILFTLMISAEIFPYDPEKIVILAISTFILLLYLSGRKNIFNMVNSKYLVVKTEMTSVFKMHIEYNLKLKNFYKIFESLEHQIIDIFNWVYKYSKRIETKIKKNWIFFSEIFTFYFLKKIHLNLIFLNSLIYHYILKNLLINSLLILNTNIKDEDVYSNNIIQKKIIKDINTSQKSFYILTILIKDSFITRKSVYPYILASLENK